MASGMGMFGVAKYLSVPAGAALVWTVIVRGRYKPVERMLDLVFADLFHLSDLRFFGKPDWKLALHDTLIPAVQRRPAIPA